MVENFRPDVKARLGITYDDLKAINPRIILASISGFGQTGPYRTRAGFDQIAQGMGGLMWLTGFPGQGPVRAGIAVADVSAGLYASIGVFVALAERERSGQGQWVASSLLQAQISLLDFQAAKYLVEGVVPQQAGNDHPYSTPMGVVKTADGFINIGVGGEGQWRAFCRAVGHPEMADDPDYASLDLRYANRPKLMARLAEIFRTRSSEAWLTALEDAGVPAGPIYKMDEVFEDPQVVHTGMAVPVSHHGRDIKLVGLPIDMSRTPAGIETLLPEAGTSNQELLTELGYTPADIESFKKERVI